jgi:hypothetical protein
MWTAGSTTADDICHARPGAFRRWWAYRRCGLLCAMNRRTLDVLIPMLYGAAVVATALLAGGKALTAVAAVGAVLVGAYFAAIRRNLSN